jgi:hypothetical protein
MPTARAEIENQIRSFLDSKFQDAQTITQDQFRQMIADNREEIKEAVDTVLSDKDAQAFIAEFMPVVEKTVAIDVKENAAEALGGFVDLNERLERLAKGEDLSALEQQQRYVLGLVQRLRIEETELQ